MSNFTSGAKAGLISGLIQGLVSAPVSYYILLLLKEEIIFEIRSSLKDASAFIHEEQIFNLVVTITSIATVIGGLLVGLVVGIVYAVIHNKLPIKSHVVKATMLSFTIWFLLLFPNLATQAISAKIMQYIWLGIIPTLVYGVLLGLLFPKFSKKEGEE